MSMQEKIEGIVVKFNKRSDEDEKLREDMAHLKKVFMIDLGDEVYSMKLENSKVDDFKAEIVEDADIVLTSTSETIEASMSGELRPMRAYITKKIKIKGSIQDLMFLKKFL
ncbi:MAG TPA: SCP2 sterol-binding domain-containing protein [Candidatus Methanomethylophilaceae archaeon]|nr:SCP2 sterol-binding domain-containing protein [Candidatus Methanomethylophilaceae archaeon]